MEAVQTTIDGTQGGTGKQKRQSYKRERKLEVIAFYHSSNLYKTSREFSLNTKTILRWVKDEQKIRGSKKDTLGSGRCLESSSCILFTSFSRPVSLYVQGTSNPFPSFLLPVTSHDTWPPCIKKCHIVFACSRGTCPTITSSFLTHTACLLWSLRGSGNTIRICPKLGVQIVL